jgi:hypothetical protein
MDLITALKDMLDELIKTDNVFELIHYHGKTYRVPLKEFVRLENREDAAQDQLCEINMFLSHDSENPCKCLFFDTAKKTCSYSNQGMLRRESEKKGVVKTHQPCSREDNIVLFLLRKGLLNNYEIKCPQSYSPQAHTAPPSTGGL